jgi:hypothetical protein
MVGGYFLLFLIERIRVASAIRTNEYVSISLNVTIAAPPLKEVDNLAAYLNAGLPRGVIAILSYTR